MKKIKLIIIILVVTGLFSSCMMNDRDGYGTLVINLPAGRSAISNEFISTLSYRVDCIGTPGEVSKTLRPNESTAISLAAGEWIVTITVLNAADHEIGKSDSKTVNIVGGSTTRETFDISIDTFHCDIFEFNVTDPDNIETIKINEDSIEIFVIDGTTITTIEFSLKHTGKGISYSYDGSDFINGLPDTWNFSDNNSLVFKVTAEDGSEKIYTVYIINPGLPITGISLDKNELELFVGDTAALVATVIPVGADVNLTWTTSDVTVAEVDTDGIVTAISPGEATITVTIEGYGYTAECIVTVTYAPQDIFAILLSVQGTTHSFGTAQFGYSPLNPLNVTVINTGNQPTGDLSVTISSAAGISAFTLSTVLIDSIAVGANANFTVVPVIGLASGTYTAIVTITGGNGISAQFNVSFTVNKATPNVTSWPTASAVFGQTLSQAIITGGSSPVEGTFTWATPDAPVGNAGTQSHSMTFTPLDIGNYNAISGNINITVTKANGINVEKPVLASFTGTTITVKIMDPLPNGQTVEYAVCSQPVSNADDLDWQDERELDISQLDAPYYIYARSKENANYFAGTPNVSSPISGQGISLTIQEIKDAGLTLDVSPLILSRQGGNKATITVTNPAGYTIEWYYSGNLLETGASITLTVDHTAPEYNVAYNLPGKHFLTVRAVSSSEPPEPPSVTRIEFEVIEE